MAEGTPAASPPGVAVERTAAGGAADLQSLLARAVGRLAEVAATRAVAWGRGPDGTPSVLAASEADTSLRRPSPALYAAALALEGATDLGGPDAPAALVAGLRDQGLAAAAPVAGGDAEPVGVLLLGRPGEAPLRPRALAELAAAARRLGGPAAAAAAASRLARLDERVRHLDRLASLGSLVAEIVHEIRNPLVSVKTFLQLLPERIDEAEFREQFLTVASEELRRVERLLDLLLEQAQPRSGAEPGRSARVDEAIDAVVRLVAHRAGEQGVRLEPRVERGLPPAALAPDALRQALLNLTLNAIDATPPGEAVRLVAGLHPGGLVLAVEDAGPGVPEALRTRIFEPFFSTKPERAGGLGLAISRRIAEECGGSLELGEGDAGARFLLRLPTGRQARELTPASP